MLFPKELLKAHISAPRGRTLIQFLSSRQAILMPLKIANSLATARAIVQYSHEGTSLWLKHRSAAGTYPNRFAKPVGEPSLALLSKFDLGHVGIFVRDLSQMVRFYQRVFGFVITDADVAGDGETQGVFLSRNPEEHHQLVLVARDGNLVRDQPAIQQVSFRTDSLAEVRRTYFALREAQLEHIDAVTHGTAWCVYFRDPENNRIEIFTDTPWYITQPFVAPVDYNKPDDVLYSETEQLCRSQAGFRMMSEWRVDIAERIQQALTALSHTP